MVTIEKKDKSNLTDKIKSRILEVLEDKEIDCTIIGREKKVFSIWNKMQKKQIAFSLYPGKNEDREKKQIVFSLYPHLFPN